MVETTGKARSSSSATGVLGKDYLIYIDNGSGTMLEIEYQNDAEFNTGKTSETKRTKNGSLPYQIEAGASISFSFQKLRPMSAAQLRLYALADSGAITAVTFEDKLTGGHKRAGNALVTITGEPTNVEGLVEVNVTLSFQGDAVTTVNT